jgi:hypothetical protein
VSQTLLVHDPNRANVTEQLAAQLKSKDPALVEAARKTVEEKLQVPWKEVQQQINHGYILPGYNLIDYIRSTWAGLPTDPVNPIDATKPRLRFHAVNIWGEAGASKTNLAVQLMGLVYGAYDPNPERAKVGWEYVQRMCIVNTQDLIDAYSMIQKANERLRLILIDDVNTIIPRQLWFEDKQLYMKLYKMLGMIRRKVGTFMTTEPNIEFLQDALGGICTFEVIVYPNSTYQVQRYCADIDPWHALKARVVKICVEYSSYSIYDVPPEFWRVYQARTNEEGNKTFMDVVEHLKGGGKRAEEMKKEASRFVARTMREVNVDSFIQRKRAEGLRIPQNGAEQFLRDYRDEVLAKLDEVGAADLAGEA